MMRFNERYERVEFLGFLDDFLPKDFVKKEEDIIINKSRHKEITKAQVLGESELLGLSILEVEHTSEHDPRVTLATDAFKILADHWIHRALVIFKSKNSDNYRFSYLTISLDLNEKNKVARKYSNARRYSFYLGPNAKIRTPEQQLIKKGPVKDLDDLLNRFSLEVVNKEFYLQIASTFDSLIERRPTPNLALPSVSSEDINVYKNFAVRLIGRVMFCWFLKQKKSESSPLISDELLSSQAVDSTEGYYHAILEPLFFEALNTPKDERSVRDALYDQIPYLNGGLFSPQHDDYYDLDRGTFTSRHLNTLVVQDEWIRDFFTLLETYNFTIDENTVFDQELSVDPEMLGRIFENLLAEINPETGNSERKRTGSFYTPRQIVEYMVDQSLLSYLVTKTQIAEEKLAALISYDQEDDVSNPLSEMEKKQVVDAIANLRVLDPACGSGAFPVGMLQKVVYILQNVDADCSMWIEKKLQMVPDLWKQKIQDYYASHPANYIRKLDVIKSSIFGVDIQPIAVEVSRLRCFLTLVVESKIDDSAQNRGIEPLPNLEFKFVCANTLIDLPKTQSNGLFDDHSGIEMLSQIMSNYFTASSTKKEEIKLKFTRAQNEILSKTIATFGQSTGELTQKLTSWDPFGNKSSSWFDPKWMFGLEEEFDIVIANPPYISALEFSARHSREERELLNASFDSARGTYDLYVLFIEKAIRLLNSSGRIAFINPNKYLSAKYAQALREYILKSVRLESLVDVSGINVFDEASVYPILSFMSKGDGPCDIKLVLPKVRQAASFELGNYTTYVVSQDILRLLPENIWGFLLSNKIDLLTKTIKDTKPLLEFGNINASSTASESDEYSGHISEFSSDSSLKLLNTGLIDSYSCSWGRKAITSKGEKYSTPYLNMKNVSERRREMYSNPKVIYAKLAKTCEAFLDLRGEFAALNTNFFYNVQDEATLKFIAAYSNSKMFMFFYEQFFGALRMAGGFYQFQAPQLRVIPCRIPDTDSLRLIERLVDEVLSITMASNYDGSTELESRIAEYQRQIDQEIYKLYKLTHEEIEMLEQITGKAP